MDYLIKPIYCVIPDRDFGAPYPEVLFSSYNVADAVNYRLCCVTYDPSASYLVTTVHPTDIIDEAKKLFAAGIRIGNYEAHEEDLCIVDELYKEQLFLVLRSLEA